MRFDDSRSQGTSVLLIWNAISQQNFKCILSIKKVWLFLSSSDYLLVERRPPSHLLPLFCVPLNGCPGRIWRPFDVMFMHETHIFVKSCSSKSCLTIEMCHTPSSEKVTDIVTFHPNQDRLLPFNCIIQAIFCTFKCILTKRSNQTHLKSG